MPPSSEFFTWIKRREPDFGTSLKGKWNKFDFTEEESYNSSELIYLRREIRCFMVQSDTVQGIQISLNRLMPYCGFVKIIDVLNVENVKETE